MFTERPLGDELTAVRERHAPESLVLDCDRDFETLPEADAEQLGLVVDSLDPISVPAEWVPPDAPDLLARYGSDTFVVGMPGDGGVTWTRQTDPPVVIVKPRLADSPDSFVDFLLAEALVEVGSGDPEQFLLFFEDRYPAFQEAASGLLDPAETYQVAAACLDAYRGLETRDVFASWDGDLQTLFDAWLDAGKRLEPRLSDLPRSIARGQTDFGDAAELACNAVKHAGEIPSPFDALNADAYREHGAAFAVEWAERTFGALE